MTPDFFPRERFWCLLDEQPDHLVPPRLIAGPPAGEGWRINPACWFGWQGAPSPDLALRIGQPEGFFDSPWIVWVDDPATRAVSPFWLGPELAHYLVEMQPGQPIEAWPRDELAAALLQSQVVVLPDHAEQRRQSWTAAARWYADHWPRGLVAMDDLVHPFLLGALRRYFRRRTRAGAFPLGDGQTEWRYVAHQEPVAAYFHRQLAARVSDVVGAVVDPSYNYVAIYQGGAALEPHTDRRACEYTVSLAVDATPEPQAQVPWPLHLAAPEGVVSVWQPLGDGLLFRGRHLSHWRDPLAEGHSSTSVLFHFVDHGVQPGDD